jgi:hypothetical protein
MNFENRVLNRRGARQLTREEINIVLGAGGIHTATLCSFNPMTKMVDGDPGEC